MRRIKLQSLKLRNFKGIRDFVLNAQGGNLVVYGDNATGKTSLADAANWLLFGKDSQNRTDFEIKTLDANNNPIHGLEHEVEGVFTVDGRTITLRKVYAEKWTKRRGSATAEFTGHTTEHFVDGVPVKKSEYDARVAEIADESVFRLLTDPTYFNQHMHWQERRNLLLEVCGDVSDADVIASNAALAELPAILSGRKLDDLRKIIAARRAEVNKELEKIPVRIDEVTRNLPELPANDRVTIEAHLLALRDQRKELEQERIRIESGGEIAEKQKRVAEIEAEMLATVRRLRSSVDEALSEQSKLRQSLNERKSFLEAEISKHQNTIATLKANIEYNERVMDDLRSEWERINAEQFTGTLAAVADACPACEQPLPAERIAEARAKAEAELEQRRAEFNQRKAKRLADISERGKQLKKTNEQLAARITEAETHINNLSSEAEQINAQLADVASQITALQAQVPDPSQDPEYRALTEQKAEIEASIAALRKDKAAALASVDAKIRALDEQIASAEGALARFDQYEQGQRRIEELKTEERRLAAEFERLEHELYLTDEFIRTKVALLEERINSRFKLAKFKLFRTLVNGGVEECCEVTYQGVPYGSLNHGAKLNVGLDIINTLAEHFGIAPPVIIDNAESVTEILPTIGQQIKLVVSAKDKVLRVETACEAVKEAV